MNDAFEVIIVGGSYAGLSAALTMGRSLRKTLVIDSGKPCNRQTPRSHNFITQDGVAPVQMAAAAKAQVQTYDSVSFKDDLVVAVEGTDGDFLVTTASGETHRAEKLLFAAGVKDILPDIPGFAWGITAVHCPYCHGYEVRRRKTGILVNDDSAGEFAQLLANWADEITVLTNGAPAFDLEILVGRDVRLIDKTIAEIVHEGGRLSAVTFSDGSRTALGALYHRPAFVQHTELPERLGCALTDTKHFEVTPSQQTTVPGIYAAGDCTTPLRSVAQAVAQGNLAAAFLNHEMIAAG